MQIKQSNVGTLESGDIMISMFPSEEPGVDIQLQSSVEHLFGEQIREVIRETVKEYGLDGVRIKAVDKGALDCTIKARVIAACVRATGKDIWKD